MLDVESQSSFNSEGYDSEEEDCPELELSDSDSDNDSDDDDNGAPSCGLPLTADTLRSLHGGKPHEQCHEAVDKKLAPASRGMPVVMTVAANQHNQCRTVKVHKYTRVEEEKLLQAVNAVRDFPVSVLQHYKNFPVCSEYQVKAITELANEESEILPGLLGHLVAINLREEDAKRQMGHHNGVKQMTHEEAVDMIAREVAASLHSIGWSHATGIGSPHHFDVAPDQDMAVRLTKKPLSMEQLETVRHWVREAWHLSLDDVKQANREKGVVPNVDHIMDEYQHDQWNLMIKIEKTSNEKMLIEREPTHNKVPRDRGISAVVAQMEMYQEWYNSQVSIRNQGYRDENDWDDSRSMQSILEHKKISLWRVGTVIGS